MKNPAKASDVIAEACARSLDDGKTEWREMRAAIGERIKSLDSEDRKALEHELSLMISRDEDQTHAVVKH